MQIVTVKPELTRELLVRLWERSLPILHKRLATLDAAATAAHSKEIPADLRTHAISEAHKLAGSLGMFGYAEGSTIAREIEILLEAPGLPAAEFLTALVTSLRATLFPPS